MLLDLQFYAYVLLTIEYRHKEVNYNIYNIGALAFSIISQNYFSKLSKLFLSFFGGWGMGGCCFFAFGA